MIPIHSRTMDRRLAAALVSAIVALYGAGCATPIYYETTVDVAPNGIDRAPHVTVEEIAAKQYGHLQEGEAVLLVNGEEPESKTLIIDAEVDTRLFLKRSGYFTRKEIAENKRQQKENRRCDRNDRREMKSRAREQKELAEKFRKEDARAIKERRLAPNIAFQSLILLDWIRADTKSLPFVPDNAFDARIRCYLGIPIGSRRGNVRGGIGAAGSYTDAKGTRSYTVGNPDQNASAYKVFIVQNLTSRPFKATTLEIIDHLPRGLSGIKVSKSSFVSKEGYYLGNLIGSIPLVNVAGLPIIFLPNGGKFLLGYLEVEDLPPDTVAISHIDKSRIHLQIKDLVIPPKKNLAIYVNCGFPPAWEQWILKQREIDAAYDSTPLDK